MPNPDNNCTTLDTIISDRLPTCYPAAKPKIEAAFSAISNLVCWDLQSCYLAASGGLSLAGNVDTKVLWDVEAADTNNLYVISSGDVTIQQKGLYHISTTLAWLPVAANDILTTTISVNGSPRARQTTQGRTDAIVYANAAVGLQLLVGEVVQVFALYSHQADPDQDHVLSVGSLFYLDMVQPL